MKPVLRKKPVVKKSRIEVKPDYYVSEAQANEMFAYYCETRDSGGILGVARKFNRARSTIIRLAKRTGWDARYEKIQAKVRDKVDSHITRKEITNLDLVRSIKNTAVKRFLEQMKAGKIEVGVRDTLAAITTEEELMEKLPEGSKPMEHDPEEIRDAVEVIKTLDGELLGRLGDMMASGAIPIEQIVDALPKSKT